jgi:hypothetical protein
MNMSLRRRRARSIYGVPRDSLASGSNPEVFWRFVSGSQNGVVGSDDQIPAFQADKVKSLFAERSVCDRFAFA